MRRMIMHKRAVVESFKHALRGIYYAIHEERNMVIHIMIGFVVLVTAALMRLPQIEFIIILLCVALVLAVETINTAFEYMVDLFHGAQIDPIVKILKDVASAAVLIVSFVSAIIGMIIFLPRFFS